MIRLRAVRERLRLSLWFLPAVFALAAVGLAVLLAAVDQRLEDAGSLFFTFGGTAEGARAVLSAIAQSMLTFTGLVFTITMLVLQLASSQLSPRVMRTFLRDRANQIVLGLFVATFVYTLLVLREVRTPVDGDHGFVPAISIWVAFALLLASVGAFIYYIDHMAHAIRANTVIANIWRETVVAVDRLFPERLGNEPHEDLPWPDLQRPDIVLKAPHAGVLVGVDEEQLLAAAATGDRALALVPAVGDFVAEESPLAHLWGSWDGEAVNAVLGATSQGEERTLEQDAAFGLRQLVDIAIRALSPGTNDPTTAVQALDRIHDLLRRLAMRRFPPRARAVDGRVRMLLDSPVWDDFVHLGLDEIRLAGGSQIQVTRRLRAILDDLAAVAPGARQSVLSDEIAALVADAERGFRNSRDRAEAAEPSARGHALGSGTRSRS